MKRLRMGVCLAVLVSVGWVWAQEVADVVLPSDQIPSATESLVDSSLSLALSPGVPYRARRLVILAEMARELDADNPDANRILADLYAAHELPAESATALRHCLVGRERDHALWQRWLDSASAEQQTAATRIEFLTGVIQDDVVPSTVRAEATVDYADILIGQGQDKDVNQLLIGSLKLDPYNRRALVAWNDLNMESSSMADKANVMFRILRGSPQDFNVAYDLAELLGREGLWVQSAVFYGHAWTLLEAEVGVENIPYSWALAYCNALLDAGEHQKAIDVFVPLVAEYPGRVDLRSLLIEAYLALGEAEEAEALVTAIEEDHSEIEGDTVQADLEMAAFYLVVKPKSDKAIALARAAIRGASEEQRHSVPLQRVYGATELLGGAIDSGVARLEAIQDTDMWASAFLANYYFHIDQPAAARQAILKGTSLGRSGPAARRLRGLASELDMPVEPMVGSAKVAQLVRNFGDFSLQMAIHPERFIELEIEQPESPIELGEPIHLTCHLKNIGPAAVPTGPMGLFDPVMAMHVSVTGLPEGVPTEYSRLPLAVWPSPRYLKSGQEITCQVQLDVGELADVLAEYPLADIELTVTGVLNPVQKGESMVSDLPTVPAPSVIFERESLLGVSSASTPEELQTASEAFLADMGVLSSSDAFSDRVVAARQVGAMQSFLDGIDWAETPAVEGLPRVFLADGLDVLIPGLLTDESPVVRAAMVQSLAGGDVMTRLEAVDTCMDDPTALVRVRVVELLGTLVDSNSKSKLVMMTEDADAHVARMAELFLKIRAEQSANATGDSESSSF
jgi:tetratricopeptide (TPR) repeat protein